MTRAVAAALVLVTAGDAAAPHRHPPQRLLDRRGDHRRHRLARPRRHPAHAAAGRLAAALLPAAARLDGARGQRRGRDPGAAAAVRPARGAGLVVGGHRRPRSPRGRPGRGGRGRLPVPDLLRAGDADVLAGRGAVRARVRLLRARLPARPPALPVAAGGLARAPALHAQLGAVPRRRDGRRVAVAVAQWPRRPPRRRAARRGRRAAVRAVGPEPRLPGRQHGGAVGPAPRRAVPARHPGQPVRLRGVGAARARGRRRAAAPPGAPRRCRCWR